VEDKEEVWRKHLPYPN